MQDDLCLDMECIDEERLNNYGCLKWLVLGVLLSGLLLSFVATSNGIRPRRQENAGNQLAQSDMLRFTQLPTQQYAIASDGNVQTQLVVGGTGKPNMTVELMNGQETLATTKTDDNGNWAFDQSFEFAPGRYDLYTRLLDEAGEELNQSSLFAFQVPSEDEVPTPTVVPITSTLEPQSPTPTPQPPTPEPVPPVVQMPANPVANTPVTLAGSSAPNAEVQILANDELIDTVMANENGEWAYDAQLSPGEYILLARTSYPDGTEYDSVPMRVTFLEPGTLDIARGTNILNSFIDAGKQTELNSQLDEGAFTLFMPSDFAFAKMPAELLETLQADPDAMSRLLRHHIVFGTVGMAQMNAGLELTTLDAGTLTIHSSEFNTGFAVNDAIITSADINAGDDIIHIIDRLLFPPSDISAPEIDSSGVATFVGDFLTVVGDSTPGSIVVLALNGETFGTVMVDSAGRWEIPNSITPGEYEIFAYSLDENGIVLAVSTPVYLTVQ